MENVSLVVSHDICTKMSLVFIREMHRGLETLFSVLARTNWHHRSTWTFSLSLGKSVKFPQAERKAKVHWSLLRSLRLLLFLLFVFFLLFLQLQLHFLFNFIFFLAFWHANYAANCSNNKANIKIAEIFSLCKLVCNFFCCLQMLRCVIITLFLWSIYIFFYFTKFYLFVK